MGLSISRIAPGVITACLAIGSASAQTHTLYSNDFENGLGTAWTGNTSVASDYRRYFTQFNGRYTNDRIDLNLTTAANPGAGKHNLYTLSFDLYIIDSWDGNSQTHGPDRFKVSIGNDVLLCETFSNQDNNQSFRRPDMGPFHMGYTSTWKDSVYRNITLQFTAEDSARIAIRFAGENLQSKSDESWGLDNAKVRYEAVPAPGAAALLGMGGLLAARRRRS